MGMKKWIGCLCIIIQGFQYTAIADTPPPGTVKVKGGTDGTVIGNVSDSQKVNVTNAISATVSGTVPVTGTFFQATQPVSGTFWQATQPVSGSLGRSWTLGFAGDKVDASGSSVSISNLPVTQAVTGTFWQATQPVSISGSVPVTGTFFQATQPVSGTFWQATQPISGSVGISGTLPAFASVPTFNLGTIGTASTAANQATEITSLTAIQSSVANIPASPATAGNQTTANTSLASIDSKLTAPLSVTGTFFQATQPVSGTVTATQTALVTGQISNNASVTTTASTFTAPANAIGFVLEAESGNTDNIRWAVGSTATASVGMLAEPGRDSGYVPLAANISVISISGTQSASVQWVIR